MKLSNLIEMLDQNLDYLRYLDRNTDVFIDLGGRERALVGIVDHKNGVLLKISDRPSEKQYFVVEDGDDGYTEISSVETSLVDITTLAKMYPDSIYFEATLVT